MSCVTIIFDPLKLLTAATIFSLLLKSRFEEGSSRKSGSFVFRVGNSVWLNLQVFDMVEKL